jgi:hypothetical protein
MYDNIYYCRNANNTCEKRDTCLRYLNAADNPTATLFKCACTSNNQYLLYINKSKETESEDGKESGDDTESTE